MYKKKQNKNNETKSDKPPSPKVTTTTRKIQSKTQVDRLTLTLKVK